MPPRPDAERPLAPGSWLARAGSALALVENAALVVLLALLVTVAFGQIVLRQLDVSIAWGDPAVRLLVLWVGVIGAVAATRAGEHITIDAVSRFLPARLRLAVGAATALFAGGVCAVFALHASRFVLIEREIGTSALLDLVPAILRQESGFELLPGWVAALVLPLGFALIAARFAVLAVGQIARLLRRDRS